MLHRDDPHLPVGPIIEALNEHVRAGRVRALGASNWTCARIDEANAYAADHGLAGFCCSSPHLSLAVQNEEHWDDTRSARDPEIFAWHERGGLPLFAWSAQARGFFAGHESESVDRVYDNADNRERRRRAGELADRVGCTTNQVALAWVLRQPFPVYAVVGARTVAPSCARPSVLWRSNSPGTTSGGSTSGRDGAADEVDDVAAGGRPG